MADNFTISDRAGDAVDLRASEDSGGDKSSIIVSEMARVSQSFTRPADTTAYAAGDAISNSTSAPSVITFVGMARNTGFGGTIIGANLFIAAYATVAPEIDLLLFDTSPLAQNDNAAFALDSDDLDHLVGVLKFNSSQMSYGNSGSYQFRHYQAVNLPLAYRCAVTGLYGIPVTRTAFTPASGTKWRFDMDIIKET